MKISSRILKLNKKEIKEIKILLAHSLIDLSYGKEGTFNKSESGDFDNKEAIMAKNAIRNIEWILNSYQ